MVKKSDIYQEDGVNLASKVPDDIASEFRRIARETPGQNLKTNLACAAKVWNSIPIDLQNELLKNMNRKNIYPILREWFSRAIAADFSSKLSPEHQKLIVSLAEQMKL